MLCETEGLWVALTCVGRAQSGCCGDETGVRGTVLGQTFTATFCCSFLHCVTLLLLTHCTLSNALGPDGSVGIATRYGLDGPGIESRWWRDFPHLSRPALGSTQPPIQRVLCLFLGVKPARAWRSPHLSLMPRIKKEYGYTPTASLGLHGLL